MARGLRGFSDKIRGAMCPQGQYSSEGPEGACLKTRRQCGPAQAGRGRRLAPTSHRAVVRRLRSTGSVQEAPMPDSSSDPFTQPLWQ